MFVLSWLEKEVEAETASFENESSIDIDWASMEDILQPAHFVEHLEANFVGQGNKLPHNEGRFLLLLPKRWRSAIWFVACVSLLMASNLFACISIFSVWSFWHALIQFHYRPVCLEFKMRTRFVSLLRTCLQRLQRRSSSLRMLLSLPNF